MVPSGTLGPILCGLDFSDRSRLVLTTALRLGRDLGVPVTVASAVDPLLAKAADVTVGPGRLVVDTARDLEALVQETASSIGFNPAVPSRALAGVAADVLGELSRILGASMIVVGSRGHRRAGRMLFGSTTARLLATTSCPVLAVPDGVSAAPREEPVVDRIVCGVDFSKASRAAARTATALALRWSCPVALLHAVDPPDALARWEPAIRDVIASEVARARAKLEELGATLPGEPSVEVVEGNAAGALVDQAALSGRTLLVLGLGGGLTHRPGTTALRVLVEADVPVLCVPEES